MSLPWLGPNTNDVLRRPWSVNGLREVLDRSRCKPMLGRAYRQWQLARYGHLLSANAPLRQCHAGKTCYILGNGVALGQYDLSALAGEYTFGCNEVFFHPQFAQLRLKFYAMVEPYYGAVLGRRYQAETEGLYADIARALSGSDTAVFLHGSLARRFVRSGVRPDQLHYLLSAGPLESAVAPANDLTRPISFMDGSFYAMAAAAIYMGFAELRLLGCGYMLAPAQIYHFYARPSFPVSLSSASAHAAVHRHAAANDLAVREIETTPDALVPDFTRNMPRDPKHEILKRFAERAGVRILNVTPDGYGSAVFDGLADRDPSLAGLLGGAAPARLHA